MDIKRTVLWVVFSLSLLMLWDSWTGYNGGLSMFAPQVVKPVPPSAGGGATPATDLPQSSAVAPTAAPMQTRHAATPSGE